jgi:hypothetical protein
MRANLNRRAEEKWPTVGVLFTVFSFALLVGVLMSRAVSLWVIARSDPIQWREFFLFRTGLMWTFLVFAASFCGVIVAGIYLARKGAGIKVYVSLALAAAALLSSMLIGVDSLVAGASVAEIPGMVVQAIPSPAVVLPELRRGFSIYFSNGSSQVMDVSTVRQLLNAAHSCGSQEIEITGYFSSAPYAKNNEENNVQLANDRADHVAALAVQSKLTPVEHQWLPGDFTALVQARGYLDEINGSRVSEVEILNRRVDLSFECESGGGLPIHLQ